MVAMGPRPPMSPRLRMGSAHLDVRVAPAYGHRYPCGCHHSMECVDGYEGRLEVAESVAFRDGQRGPAVLVFAIPDFGVGAVGCQEFHGGREVLVSRSVHRR